MQPPEEDALLILEGQFVKNNSPAAAEVKTAAQDCYKRLLGFAMEGEARGALKKRADEEAIRVFADNLRELLLASPLGQKTVARASIPASAPAAKSCCSTSRASCSRTT